MNIFLEFALKLRRLYWRIFRPHTRGVRALIIDDRSRILLVRHAYRDGWFLPGGKVKRTESLEDGLRREFREEVGITSFVIERTLGVYLSEQEYKRDAITVFVVKRFERAPTSHFEIKEAGNFPLDALPAGTSPGTRRRVEEYLGKQPLAREWQGG